MGTVPKQALVRERIKDWGQGLCKALGKKLVELTGDYTPDLRALMAADVIICTPEKWDGISRAWASRAYVTKVALLIIDEIHLLGADRCVSTWTLQGMKRLLMPCSPA
jgi:activating signal cointegrator complex subunit 3